MKKEKNDYKNCNAIAPIVQKAGWKKAFIETINNKIISNESYLFLNSNISLSSAWKFFIGLSVNEKVLIVESHLGDNAISSVALGLDVVTIARSEPIEICIRARGMDYGYNLNIVQSDNLKGLPFDGNSFDIIVVSEINDIFKLFSKNCSKREFYKNVLVELKRLLKPDGAIYIKSNSLSLKTIYKNMILNTDSHLLRMRLKYNKIVVEKELKIRPSAGNLITCNHFNEKKNPIASLKSKIKDLKNLEEIGYICKLDSGVSTKLSILEYIEKNIKEKDNQANPIFKKFIAGSGGSSIIDMGEYIVRIPLPGHQRSLKRWEQNYTALSLLNILDLPFSIPAPILVNKIYGHSFSIESKLDGVEIDIQKVNSAFRENVFLQAVNVLASLFQKTAFPCILNQEYFSSLLSGFLKELTYYMDKKSASCIDQIRCIMEHNFLNKRTILSHTHGDFKLGNMKFDKNYNISGIFDWDLSVSHGLPLMDLFFYIGYEESNITGNSFQDIILSEFIIKDPLQNQLVEKYINETANIENVNAKCIALISIVSYFIHHMGPIWLEVEANKIELERVISIASKKIKEAV
jgi:hypothetical protein